MKQITEGKIENRGSGDASASPAGEGDGRVWVVVVTKPGQERRAKRELQQQDFEVYLPLKMSELVTGPRKGETVFTPFFPRYMFVRVPKRVAEWRSIFSTIGVSGVLGCSHERATAVKNEVVEMIRAHEDAGYIRMGVAEALPGISRGESLRHTELGLEAAFLERVDAKRAMILVSFMGRESPQTVDLRMWQVTGGK